jgi:hypothetical protein
MKAKDQIEGYVRCETLMPILGMQILPIPEMPSTSAGAPDRGWFAGPWRDRRICARAFRPAGESGSGNAQGVMTRHPKRDCTTCGRARADGGDIGPPRAVPPAIGCHEGGNLCFDVPAHAAAPVGRLASPRSRSSALRAISDLEMPSETAAASVAAIKSFGARKAIIEDSTSERRSVIVDNLSRGSTS